MSRELKHCPFCGGKAEQKETYKYIGLGKSIPQYYVKCGNVDCGLYVATCNRDTKEEAVEIWNRREVTNERTYQGHGDAGFVHCV